LSFPKVLGGLLYFEDHHPELTANDRQCAALLPALDEMGQVWKRVMQSKDDMRAVLTPAQERYIFDNKRSIETAKSQREAQEKLARKLGSALEPGALPTVGALCAQRADEGQQVSDYPRAGGELLITPQDIATGIVFMDDDPQLRMTPYQASALGPLFDALDAANGQMGLHFDVVLKTITSQQVKGVENNIREIVPYKSKFYEGQQHDTIYDPLIDRVIALCQSKLRQPG